MADKLVLMEKDGEQLRVHPTTVEAHKAVGWKVVEDSKAASESPAEEVPAAKTRAGAQK
jgi:hypothetical protein